MNEIIQILLISVREGREECRLYITGGKSSKIALSFAVTKSISKKIVLIIFRESLRLKLEYKGQVTSFDCLAVEITSSGILANEAIHKENKALKLSPPLCDTMWYNKYFIKCLN